MECNSKAMAGLNYVPPFLMIPLPFVFDPQGRMFALDTALGR